MKPPVEAPTSRQRRPAGSTAVASSALASLRPPRETNSGAASTATATSSGTSSPGLAARRRWSPRCTSPASTEAAARLREGNIPRRASSVSSRTRGVTVANRTGYPARRMARLPLKSVRNLPWVRVVTLAAAIAGEGRRRWERLSRREQDQLLRILRKSRGRPGNVTAGERAELRRIVWKAVGPER